MQPLAISWHGSLIYTIKTILALVGSMLTAMVLIGMLALSATSFGGFYGIAYANSIADMDEKPKQFRIAHDESLEKKNTCPSQQFLEEPKLRGARQILDISYTAQNDEDSGIVGYWALDHFREHLKVWNLADGSFYALKQYDGIFASPQGALDPGTGTHVQNESSFGVVTGGYVAIFNGTFAPGTNPTRGNTGAFNYGGTTSDILLNTYDKQTGAPHPYDWVSAYFAASSGFTQTHWGWAYVLDPQFRSASTTNQWCNYNDVDGGNSGNIVS